MFIDKTLIIIYTNICPIYIKRNEGGKRLDTGETEREREREKVWETERCWKLEVALVVKTAVGEMDHFGISQDQDGRII